MDKSEQQAVLRFRYIHNYSWPMIADELGVDRGTVQRWHNKAVAKITLPENAIDLKKCICLQLNAAVSYVVLLDYKNKMKHPPGVGFRQKNRNLKKCTPVGEMHLFVTHCNGALCDIVKMQIQN